MSGADFLIGKVLGKGRRQSIAPEGIAVTREQIDDAIAATAGVAKKMASGVSLAKRQLDEIRSSGLTGEALVVLVHSRCKPVKTLGGRLLTPSVEQVQGVLEALFSIGELVR